MRNTGAMSENRWGMHDGYGKVIVVVLRFGRIRLRSDSNGK